MKTKFTPGPWIAGPQDIGRMIESPTAAINSTIGCIHGCSEADAHLIAAAPEMYDLLEWTIEMLEGEHPESVNGKNLYGDRVRSLLKKARGEL